MAIFTLVQNLKSMIKTGLQFIVLICVFNTVFAQDTLPDISVTLLGKKALIAWKNNFENITSINIQRSGDSVRNFKSISSMLNPGAKSNGFVDQKEFLPNEQYYRLFITFEGGEYLFTKAHQPVPDTSHAVPALADILKEGEAKEKEKEEPEKKKEVKPVQLYFIPSVYVHTGKDQNVIISLPDAEHKKYSIKFYEDDGTFLFELKKIPESNLILDKANFSHSGLFRFELYESGILKEAHKVYIPKTGKHVPLLDINGYEIKK